MRVLHIANFSLAKHGNIFYSTDRKLSAGFVRNGHHVYDISDRDMARCMTPFNSKKLGRKKMNEAVLQTASNLQPDLILLGHTNLLYESTLDALRSRVRHARIAQWFVDPLFLPQVREHLFQRLPHLDAFFCTTGGDWLDPFRKVNANCHYLPNPVDEGVESLKNHEKRDFDNDLVYVGSDHKDPKRRQMLQKLLDHPQQLRFALYASLGKPRVFGAEYLDVLARSKMGLNLSRRSDIPYYSSDRIAQLTGNGLLTFIPETPGLRSLFDEGEVVYFERTAELFDKAIYYLNHDDERQEIARKGWERAHRSYATDRVARFITEATFELPLGEAYEWLDA